MKRALTFLVLVFSTNMVANNLTKQLAQLQQEASEKMFSPYIDRDQQSHWQGICNTALMISWALESETNIPSKTLKSLKQLLVKKNNFEPLDLCQKLDAIEQAIPLAQEIGS